MNEEAVRQLTDSIKARLASRQSDAADKAALRYEHLLRLKLIRQHQADRLAAWAAQARARVDQTQAELDKISLDEAAREKLSAVARGLLTQTE